MKHTFIAYDGKLTPATDEAEAWLRKIKPGDIVEVDVARPRSQQHHKLFFAMLKIVQDNRDGGSIDELLDIIKLGIGHTRVIELPGGGLYLLPKSISFAALDQDSFDAFFNRAVDYVISDILPGIDRQALTNEVFEMAGLGGMIDESLYNKIC